MPNFSDYIFNSALNLGSAGIYVGIVNNLTSNAYKAGPSASDGRFDFTAVPAGTYTVYTSPNGAGLPPGGSWTATGETNYVVSPTSPVANSDLAGPLLNAITPGSNLSAGSAPGGVGAQSVALINNPTLTGLLSAQGGLTLTGLLTMLDALSKIVPGATSFSLRNNANNADNLLMSDAGAATIRAGLTVSAGSVTVPDQSFLMRKLKLENNVTRFYSQQGPGSLAATTTMANYGSAGTITPAVNSLIICVVTSTVNCDFAGATNVGLKVRFNGGDGVSGGGGTLSISPVSGSKVTQTILDIFVATAGAVTLQPQMNVGNNSNLTTAGQGLVIFALAIPST